MTQGKTSETAALLASRVEFSRRLQAELVARGWSQADLISRADPVAESEKAKLQPYDVSNYIRARALPRPEKLTTIAKVLGLRDVDLLPERITPQRSASSPMQMREQEDGNVWLRIERAVSYPVALKIMALLAEEDSPSKT